MAKVKKAAKKPVTKAPAKKAPVTKAKATTKAAAKKAAPKSAKAIVAKNLADGVRAWIARGGRFGDVVANENDLAVSTKDDVAALCEALDALAKNPKLGATDWGSPLFSLLAFFQSVANKDRRADMVRDGLPRLRAIIGEVLDGKGTYRDDDVLFILKMFAGYRQEVDALAVAEVARRGFDKDGFMWSVVFGMFESDHPHALALVEALRDPLPSDFIGVAYLDLCNQLAIAGVLEKHPFDSNAGVARLAGFLRDPDPENASYAHSATVALPFVKHDRATLLSIAANHSSIDVRMEAAWAAAKCGEAKAIDRLVKWAEDPTHASRAQQYLVELGHEARIPTATKEPSFQALAEMSQWLAHPNELGQPPKSIELYDLRELYWPPTKDRREVALVKYTTQTDEVGIGMVGSVTFALFGENTANRSPEDMYALHCCWELGKDRNVKAGRKLLAAKNAGF